MAAPTFSGEFKENIPRRLKPVIDLVGVSGTDKSVPFQNLGLE
jgi:hypothetical protein